ncbi:MAG: FGGY-family carbohydrate kinase [Acidobacteriota bacterium]|nr:MAG: FGGY-family carbohydrate kinase [Acidobacteriota bacterium]
MSYLLAFDVGTTRTKAVLMAVDGSLIATASETYPVIFPRPHWAEQDQEDWWRAVGSTSHEVLRRSRVKAEDVIGVSFSTQMLNVICLDRNREVIGRSISWIDGRAADEARSLMRRFGGEGIFAALLGATLTGKDFLPKYLWFKKHEPELLERAATLIDANGYLLFRSTGRLMCEWGNASVTGLFNLRTKMWDTGLMRFLGVDRTKFPDLAQSSENVGGLTDEAAGHLGLLPGTPVFAGSGDAMTAAVGAGAVGEGQCHLSLGTSAFLGIMTERKVTGRHGMASIQSADPGKLLLIGETEAAGACLKWAAKELYGASDDDAGIYRTMDADAAESEAAGLIFTPWMYGERSPVPDHRLRAGFINLSANHTRAQMTRAIYEGVAYNLRWILELMDELYRFRPEVLRVIGGGARGRPWLRVIADVTGRTLETTAWPQEAGAIGASMLASVGLGIHPSVEAAAKEIKVVEKITPDQSANDMHNRNYEAFQSIYRALRGVYSKLNVTGRQRDHREN